MHGFFSRGGRNAQVYIVAKEGENSREHGWAHVYWRKPRLMPFSLSRPKGNSAAGDRLGLTSPTRSQCVNAKCLA